ncbi:MAG: multifunctional CCA tRNA nucleotidyl transferase/2'3'-cyclic phosphodiesterase/2'nucleotidase/phosphatase [Gammaproteobacteria bacterium]|nr:multifunctional CCA tRNA nucleotidyl transferase/2'3'-cyclic phosphodiesterase/2'nucleotidase/phosphatase [Gammaproteobacteria bacterium]
MEIYLVGGAIRDRLLGLPTPYEKDWVVVNGTPDELITQGFIKVGKSFPVFINPESGEEYALARTERKTGEGYNGFEFDAGPNVTLEEDLSRRDLTINAIAENQDGELIDPFNGQKDIANKTLRHVSDAFQEDPLRVLRIARFKAKLSPLDFVIAEETKTLINDIVDRGELSSLVPERTWLETEKVLKGVGFNEYFKTLIEFKALEDTYPDLTGLDVDFFSHPIIQKAAYEDHSKQFRFASIFYALIKEGKKNAKDKLESMQKNMRFANAYKDMPMLLINSVELIQSDPSKYSAEHLLTILEKLDALRQPNNLEEILNLLMLDADDNFIQKKNLLQLSLGLVKNIKINNLKESGLEGSEIARKIREIRLMAIKKEIENPNI